jgi:hypothetical protein
VVGASGMDVIRPCQRIDRIPSLNPIPEDRESLIRFRDKGDHNHGVYPMRRFARSARSFLTTGGIALAIPASGRPQA